MASPFRAGQALAEISLAPIVKALTSVSYGPMFNPLNTSHLWHFKDIPYCTNSSHKKHTLDVAIMPPQPNESRRPLQPVLWFIHGGSWSAGDKRLSLNMYSNLSYAACQYGEAVGIVTNYRLSPEVRFPEHLDDLAASLAWTMRNIAGNYGGDRRKIVVCGHSAGAHLATSLALRWPGMKRRIDPTLPDIAGLISLSGVHNVLRLGQSPFAPALTDAAFGKDEAFLRAASPVYAVLDGSSSSSLLRDIPVMLLNAQEDFHLASDAEELDLALAHAITRATVGNASVSPLVTEHKQRALQSMRQCLLEEVQNATTGKGIDWAAPHAPNVLRGIVTGTNHLTIVGGIGQPRDPTTAAIGAFLKMIARHGG